MTIVNSRMVFMLRSQKKIYFLFLVNFFLPSVNKLPTTTTTTKLTQEEKEEINTAVKYEKDRERGKLFMENVL